MATQKNTWYRKRAYSKVHVLTWTIYLEKDGFVPCAFQNCNYMAFNVLDMKNHFGTCKGNTSSAAPYACQYCKRRTEHADKLDEHILRYHKGQPCPEKKPKLATDSIKPKEHYDESADMNWSRNNLESKQKCKLLTSSWEISEEMYGYIKCPDCCLLTETVEQMQSHHSICDKDPSALPFECSVCRGRADNMADIDKHLVDRHKSKILDNDRLMKNVSSTWQVEIDRNGFAKCGTKCSFVHVECSKMIEHLQSGCLKEDATDKCQALIECSVESCAVWSTSRVALFMHKNRDHIPKGKGRLANDSILDETPSENVASDCWLKVHEGSEQLLLDEVGDSQNIGNKNYSKKPRSYRDQSKESSCSPRKEGLSNNVTILELDKSQNLRDLENNSDPTVLDTVNLEESKDSPLIEPTKSKLRANVNDQLDSIYVTENTIEESRLNENEISDFESQRVDEGKFNLRKNSRMLEKMTAREFIVSPYKEVERGDESTQSTDEQSIIEKMNICYSKMSEYSNREKTSSRDGKECDSFTERFRNQCFVENNEKSKLDGNVISQELDTNTPGDDTQLSGVNLECEDACTGIRLKNTVLNEEKELMKILKERNIPDQRIYKLENVKCEVNENLETISHSEAQMSSENQSTNRLSLEADELHSKGETKSRGRMETLILEESNSSLTDNKNIGNLISENINEEEENSRRNESDAITISDEHLIKFGSASTTVKMSSEITGSLIQGEESFKNAKRQNHEDITLLSNETIDSEHSLDIDDERIKITKYTYERNNRAEKRSSYQEFEKVSDPNNGSEYLDLEKEKEEKIHESSTSQSQQFLGCEINASQNSSHDVKTYGKKYSNVGKISEIENSQKERSLKRKISEEIPISNANSNPSNDSMKCSDDEKISQIVSSLQRRERKRKSSGENPSKIVDPKCLLNSDCESIKIPPNFALEPNNHNEEMRCGHAVQKDIDKNYCPEDLEDKKVSESPMNQIEQSSGSEISKAPSNLSNDKGSDEKKCSEDEKIIEIVNRLKKKIESEKTPSETVDLEHSMNSDFKTIKIKKYSNDLTCSEEKDSDSAVQRVSDKNNCPDDLNSKNKLEDKLIESSINQIEQSSECETINESSNPTNDVEEISEMENGKRKGSRKRKQIEEDSKNKLVIQSINYIDGKSNKECNVPQVSNALSSVNEEKIDLCPSMNKDSVSSDKTIESEENKSNSRLNLEKVNSTIIEHDNSANAVPKVRKKRGRPKKESCDSVKRLEEVNTTIIQMHVNTNAVPKVRKKRGRPKKESCDSVERLEEVNTTIIQMHVNTNAVPKVRKKRGRPKKESCDSVKRLEEVNTTSLVDDGSNSNSTIFEKLECKIQSSDSIDSSLTMEDDTKKNCPSMKEIKKKRGRPGKMNNSLKNPSESGHASAEFQPILKPNLLGLNIGESCGEVEDNSQSIIVNQTKLNEDCKERKEEEILSQDEHHGTVSLPEQTVKRRPGRPKKIPSTQSDALAVPYQLSNNIEAEQNQSMPQKRTVSKPRKLSYYIIDDSSLDSDEAQLQSTPVITDQSDEPSSLSIPTITPKRGRGRPKKTQAAISNVTIDSEQSSGSKQNRSGRSIRRIVSKPKKFSSYVTDLDESGTGDTIEKLSKEREASSITVCSGDLLNSNDISLAIKRKPGRPRKSHNPVLDVSIDAEKFSSALEVGQNVSSTPNIKVSKTRKPRDDDAESAKSKSEEEIIKRKRNTPRNHRKRYRILSDESDSDEKSQTKSKPNKSVDEFIGADSANKDVEMEFDDKNGDFLSPARFSNNKKGVVRKKETVTQKRSVAVVTCSACKESMPRFQYEIHAQVHNYFCWVEGETPYDFEKEEEIHRRFFRARKYRNFKGFKCEKCGIYKKSSVGYISHQTTCGASVLEKENLKISCPVCRRYMLPSSLKVHMGTDHRPSIKPFEADEDIKINYSGSKRAAAARAEHKIQKVEAFLGEDSEKSDFQRCRKFYSHRTKANHNRILMNWKCDLEKDKELLCPDVQCPFKTKNLADMQYHHSECSRSKKDFICKICGAREPEAAEIQHHILINHQDVLDKADSYQKSDNDDEGEEDDDEDEGEDELEEEEKYEEGKGKKQNLEKRLQDSEQSKHQQQISINRTQTFLNRKPKFFKSELYGTGLDFIYRNMQTIHDRLQVNHVYDRVLYEDLFAVPNGFIKENDLLRYLPNTPVSMRFSFNNENWEQLKLMEGRTTEESSVIFVGGPVWAMDWCPVPLEDKRQWLAVAYHRNMDATHNMSEIYSYNNVIQIWDCGNIDLCTNDLQTPVLSIGIAHSHGTVWDMRWCPNGCYQPDNGRLGLLAVAFSSGFSVIYSVPLIPKKGDGKPIYKLIPVRQLMPPNEAPVQCCRIAWSTDSPFNIMAVGYFDGSIALYDIMTGSLLLKDGPKIHPYKVFNAHSESVTALQFIHNKSGKLLMSASLDKSMKFWNLENTSAPISVSRRMPIRDCVWMENWLCAVSVIDDVYTYASSNLFLHNFRDYIYLQSYPWLSLNGTQLSLSTSTWSNSIAMASESGEIVTIHPKQMFYIDCKAVKKNFKCLSTTHLKKFNPDEEEEEKVEEKEKDNTHKGRKMNVVGPFNYKDATENYGLILSKSYNFEETSEKEKKPKSFFPIASVNNVSFNPNRQAFTFLAVGQQCGIVRIIRDYHFDYVRNDLKNFSDSLLLR